MVFRLFQPLHIVIMLKTFIQYIVVVWLTLRRDSHIIMTVALIFCLKFTQNNLKTANFRRFTQATIYK